MIDAFFVNQHLEKLLLKETLYQKSLIQIQDENNEQYQKLLIYEQILSSCQEKKNIVLIGNMGVGKSTIGNKLVKKKRCI